MPLGYLPGFCALEAVASSLGSQHAVLGHLMINEKGSRGCERSRRTNLERPETFADPKGPGFVRDFHTRL